MKKMIIPVLGIVALILFSCKDKQNDAANAPTKNYLVDMNGIDSLKLDMSKAELEKILDTTLTFQHIHVDGGFSDTLNIKYKEMDFVIYLEETDSQSVAKLVGLKTEDSSCKTSVGIGVGSDKIKVINGYPGNKKYVALEYEEYPVRSKTKSVVAVMDTAGYRAIQFHILNRKVVCVEVTHYYEFY
ncbi:MAG: hypothetical protein ABI688_10550 [Bacteroidota bacterium]